MGDQSSSPEEFLRHALGRMCLNDAETISNLVFHCERAEPRDASEFLRNTIQNDCEQVIEEYLRRRCLGSQSSTKTDFACNFVQIYKKHEISLSTPITGKKKNVAQGTQATKSASVKSKHNALGIGGNTRTPRKNQSKTSGATVINPINARQDGPCDCQARKHKLVTNCLACGKIICEKEGEGPCSFCGNEIWHNDTSSKDLGGPTKGKSEAEDKANMLKNKLLEQDHRENLRTTIIDDQSDWYDLNGNMWMTTEEKKELLRKHEEEEAKTIRQNRTVLLLDAAGGKVSVCTEVCVRQTDIAFHFGKKENVQVVHIMPNPDIRECPVYVATENSSRHNGPINRRIIPESMKVRSGRIQHDDQLFDFPNIQPSTGRVLSQIGFISETDGKENHLSLVNVNGDHLASSSMAMGPPNHGSMLGMTPEISSLEETDDSISGVFDICRHKNDAESPTGELIELSPSLYHQTKLNKQSEDHRIQIIMPGMILLKFCLSKDDQIHIVKTCQKLGVGNGGFYQPGYGDRSKLHLRMMCLGKNWNPELRAYEDMRSFDNARPPSIPAEFLSLVYKSIQAAHTAIRKDSNFEGEDVENVLPSSQPDVCLVNFYNESGRLGLHQDKDESKSSLEKRLPVVSFSIGDSAEFLYSTERDINNASKIVLESGDVLIFGGASRHIFHGISYVEPHTSPKWLTQKAELRPGRLNLTFRQIQ